MNSTKAHTLDSEKGSRIMAQLKEVGGLQWPWGFQEKAILRVNNKEVRESWAQQPDGPASNEETPVPRETRQT